MLSPAPIDRRLKYSKSIFLKINGRSGDADDLTKLKYQTHWQLV
jgi:hypothetical protein